MHDEQREEQRDEHEPFFGLLFFFNFNIWFRVVLNFKQEGAKKCRKFSYGLKNLAKLGAEIINFKLSTCRTIFGCSSKLF